MQIIDGYCGRPNIYADDIGQYNISMWGPGDWVIPAGEQLGYELISNNEVKIKDGLFITQGRRGVLKKGTTESCVIENGTQAENRNDLIVIEYTRDASTMEESHTLKVIKGTPGETAMDPEITTGNIPGGDLLHQMPLYRVKLEGLNIVAVEQMFKIGKISPETVDPTLASEEGLAADAKLTGELIGQLNENIPFPLAIQDGQYGYIAAGEDGADTFVPFSSVYYLGAGTSFDISALFPALDYTKLSVNNFLVCASNTSRTVATTNVGGTTRSSVASGNTIGISYDNTTGLLKITGTAQTISFVSSGDTYASANQNLSCKVYLVIGNVHII